MLSTAGEELADGMGESDTLIEQEESVLAGSSNRKTGSIFRAVLLSTCGPSTYRLIRNLVAPNKPTDKSYADLLKIVGLHFNPKPSVAVQRFKFNSRSKQPGETVSRLRDK